MDQVSMQLYAKEKIASARAEADIQRQLDQVKKAKKVESGPSQKPANNIVGRFTSFVTRLRQTITFKTRFGLSN